MKKTYSPYNKAPWVESSSNISHVIVKDKICPITTEYWFNGTWSSSLSNCSYFDLSNLDTSQVTDMDSMFASAGKNATTFELKGVENWDTSNVTSMRQMFDCAGKMQYILWI